MVSLAYDHVQRGKLHVVLHLLSLGLAVLALVPDDLSASLIVGGVAALLWFCALNFHYLRVRDEGDALSLRFGPIPLMRKRIPYVDIEEAAHDTTRLVDGWGVHIVPGRGWTWNIWGWDCVRLRVRGKTLRIGSDDVDNLLDFLTARMNTA